MVEQLELEVENELALSKDLDYISEYECLIGDYMGECGYGYNDACVSASNCMDYYERF